MTGEEEASADLGLLRWCSSCSSLAAAYGLREDSSLPLGRSKFKNHQRHNIVIYHKV